MQWPLVLVTILTAADSFQIYKDPPASKPDSGYGFIVELDKLGDKKPKKYVVDP